MENPQPSSPYNPSPATNTLAIISLVTGIVGWTLIPILGSIAAVITGHMAKKAIRESATPMGGNGMATWGLILGYSSLALIGLAICVIVVLALLGPAIGNSFMEINSQLQ